MDFGDWLNRKGQACTGTGRPHLLSVGGEVAGWRILSYLAYGGTSEVYRVTRDGTVAALKIARDPDLPHIAERFEREADLLRRLDSPYFAKYFCHGTWQGRPYLVTEHLQPLELPASDDAVAALAMHLTNALAELHRLHHVHRDVKPTNILTRDGLTPVLVDLGYAKPFSERHMVSLEVPLSVEQSHVVGLGTPGYAAPEQFTGEDLTPAADIHALGVLLNDCFGGQPPKDWQPLVRRATSSLANQRYATMTDFSRAIRLRHLRHRLTLFPAVGAAILVTAFLVRTAVVRVANRIEAARTQVFVDAAAPAGGDGSRARPFTSITNALKHVPWFGTVTVAAGTYDGPVGLDEKCIVLRSERGPEHTVLRNPTNRTTAVVVISDRGEGSTLDGFTLTGGNGISAAGNKSGGLIDRYGGGLACEVSATIRRCHIVGNGRRGMRHDDRMHTPYLGGGVYIGGGNVMMEDCLVASNCAWFCGGGLCVAGTNSCLTLDNCQVLDNVAEGQRNPVGGLALSDHGKAEVSKCRFAGNMGSNFGIVPGEQPAGTDLTVQHSQIDRGARGGGVYNFRADPESLLPATNTAVTTISCPSSAAVVTARPSL